MKQNSNATARNIAIRCLGLCALLDKDFAQTHVLLFLQAAQIDEDEIKSTALEILFDLLTVFGVSAFDANNGYESQEWNPEGYLI